jgi:hypothetical protein
MSEKYYYYLNSNLLNRVFIPVELNFQGRLKYSKYYYFIKEFLSKNLFKIENNFIHTLGKRKSLINTTHSYIDVNYSENNNPLADRFKCIDTIINCDKR